ncbi:FecR family protein [Flammeovirga pacifica]|uniref:Uncharacterized protein n=1 Tax=Flammeovirga pacifica TaxID=915059 RepID=A0A1S1YSP3_FLAPC|nr:FecR family protein [Flammeovirga pacifica]OHX63825.1 hypothetical protein NH26_19630 [Flammeovirga pacifica]
MKENKNISNNFNEEAELDFLLSSLSKKKNKGEVNQAWKKVVRKHSYQQKTKERKIYFYAASMAAMLVLTIGSFFYNSILSDKEIQWQSVNVAQNNRASIVLPDGTSVLLNSDSELLYPSDFSKENRIVKLKGTALFDVVTDKENVFNVLSDSMNIEVLGTKFVVTANNEDGVYQTTLLRGKVDVVFPQRKQKIQMKPQDQLYLNTNSGRLLAQKVNTTLWNNAIENDIIRIKNKSFKYLVDVLSIRYQKKIYTLDSKLLKEQITFTIHNEDLNQLLEVLKEILEVDYKETTHGIELFKK